MAMGLVLHGRCDLGNTLFLSISSRQGAKSKKCYYFLIAIKPMPESKFHGFVQMVCDITNNCDDRKNGTSRGRCKELLKLAESFLN
jgi:hypothetical protein